MEVLNLFCDIGFFAGADVQKMVKQDPRLLLLGDLEPRIARVSAHLFKLHPAKDMKVINSILIENPELLWRMDYYPDATLLDELPIEVHSTQRGSAW